MISHTKDAIRNGFGIERKRPIRLDIQIIPILLLQDILAAPHIGDIIDLRARHRDRQAGMLGDILPVHRTRDIERRALGLQGVDDPALADGVVRRGGAGGGELLVGRAGVGQRVAVGDEHQVAALGEVAAHAPVAVLEDERVRLGLVGVRDGAGVGLAAAALRPLDGAEGVVQAEDLAVRVGDGDVGRGDVGDAVVGLYSFFD
jgi:hypothetical protein